MWVEPHPFKPGADSSHQAGSQRTARFRASKSGFPVDNDAANSAGDCDISTKRSASILNALTALERNDFDVRLLDELKQPLPELADFSRSFLHLAQQITLRAHNLPKWANARAIQEGMLPARDLLEGCSGYVDVHAFMRPPRTSAATSMISSWSMMIIWSLQSAMYAAKAFQPLCSCDDATGHAIHAASRAGRRRGDDGR